jgi:hypothetical protein
MRAVALSVLLALTCIACHSDRMCAAIGAESGVGFDLSVVLPQYLVDVTACVENTCVHQRTSTERSTSIFVPDPTLTSPTVVRVSLIIKGFEHTTAAMEDSTTVQLHAVEPNSPDCPPLVYQANVDVSADGIHPSPSP